MSGIARAAYEDMEPQVVVAETIEVELVPDEMPSADEIAAEAAREVGRALPHSANLVLGMQDDELSKLGHKIIEIWNADEQSRVEWSDAYRDALRLFGLKVESRSSPWPNACGVVHPMITEAVIRFQATTIMDMFPLSGPCKVKVDGPEDDKLTQAAARVQAEMNYVTTKMMPEYRTEVEQGLWRLGSAGMVFRKVWMDPTKRRPVAQTIPAEDVVVPFGSTHIFSAPRITHIMRLYKEEVDRYIHSGWWFEHDLATPMPAATDTEIDEAKTQGIEPSNQYDDRYQFIEMQIDLDLPGFEHTDETGRVDGLPLPYVVTVETGSMKVMAIRRNWAEGDPTYSRLRDMVAYCYIPGFGFYGIGLLTLMAGLATGATSILRQTVDAGTLSNLPAGYKGKGFRTRNDSTPLKPGEFRDIEFMSGKIADNIFQLQFKEPSSVLVGLMGSMVEEGRRIGSVAELPTKTGEMPVGTIVAMIEHQTKPQSAVQARIYAAFADEIDMIKDALVRSGHTYQTKTGRGHDFQRDLQMNLSVVPVSDPGAASSAVRILQAQAVVELAARNPQQYDQPYVHRAMLRAMGVGDVDAMVPNKENVPPADPITENMHLMTGKPVKAGIEQDHRAHIKAHMTLIEDPRTAAIIGQSPTAQATAAAISAHVAEHMAFLHRQEVLEKMGFPLPTSPLPPALERRVAPLIAEAASRAAMASKAQAQQQQAQEQAQDPVLQLQQKDAAIREEANRIRQDKINKDFAVDMANVQIKAKEAGAKMATEAMRAGDARKEAGARLVNDILNGIRR